MHRRKLALLAALSVAGAFVACTLNPQPLPPSDGEATAFGDASARSDSGAFNADPEAPPASDASAGTVDGEGGAEGGDAGAEGGDAGAEGGDAGPDADSG